jgi:hypothetical protein
MGFTSFVKLIFFSDSSTFTGFGIGAEQPKKIELIMAIISMIDLLNICFILYL